MSNTRRLTKVWEIGHPIEKLSGKKLPSQKEVLLCYFYNRQVLRYNCMESKKRALMQCIAFWESAAIPTDVFQHIAKKFDKLLEKYKNLKKSKARKWDINRIMFADQIEMIFDIAHNPTLENRKYTEKKEFVSFHRNPGRPGCLENFISISAHDEQIFSGEIKKSINKTEKPVKGKNNKYKFL